VKLFSEEEGNFSLIPSSFNVEACLAVAGCAEEEDIVVAHSTSSFMLPG
jgi:hypothetical protein